MWWEAGCLKLYYYWNMSSCCRHFLRQGSGTGHRDMVKMMKQIWGGGLSGVTECVWRAAKFDIDMRHNTHVATTTTSITQSLSHNYSFRKMLNATFLVLIFSEPIFIQSVLKCGPQGKKKNQTENLYPSLNIYIYIYIYIYTYMI